MGNLRLSTALAGALIISPLTTAHAADFSFPPQPVVSVPSPVPVPEYTNGWYVRGDIAYGLMVDPDLSQSGASFRRESIDDTWGFGAGFGYIFDEHFRGDLTIDYRLDADVKGSDRLSGSIYDTDVQSTVGLANIYYDFAAGEDFRPYIGAGIGFSVNETGSLSVFNGGALVGNVAGQSETSLAAAGMAGFSYKLDGGWLVDAGYRFLYLGDAKTGNINPVVPEVSIDDISSHEIRFGLRYEFR